MTSATQSWGRLLNSQRSDTFSEAWVKDRLSSLSDQLIGAAEPEIRFLKDRNTDGTLIPMSLEYAKKMLPITDVNAARLLSAALDGRMTYVRGEWHFYNEIYHQPLGSVPAAFWVVTAFADEYSQAMDRVKEEAEAEIQRRINSGMNATPAQIRKSVMDGLRDYIAFDRRIRDNAGINALMGVFTRTCTEGDDYFDHDYKWLVCQNGILDLERFRETGGRVSSYTFRGLSQSIPASRACTVELDPLAPSPEWHKFLESSIPDEDTRLFLQRLVGAALIAEVKTKVLPNLQGEPNSGKSVFLATIGNVLGGYAGDIDGSAILESRGDTNFETDKLRGLRFPYVTEPDETKRVNNGFIKKYTGDIEVTSRTLHRESTGWRPQGIIFIASNDPVRLNTQDRATLDRLALVQFPFRFWKREEVKDDAAWENEIHRFDPTLEARLSDEDEQKGILAWAIEGARMYLKQGIGKPEVVAKAGTQYSIDSSSVLSWVQEKIESGDLIEASHVGEYSLRSYALLGELYRAYTYELSANGDSRSIVGKREFGRHLRAQYGDTALAGGMRVPKLIGAKSLIDVNGSTRV